MLTEATVSVYIRVDQAVQRLVRQHVLHYGVRLLMPLRSILRHHILAVHGQIALQFAVLIHAVPGKRRNPAAFTVMDTWSLYPIAVKPGAS